MRRLVYACLVIMLMSAAGCSVSSAKPHPASGAKAWTTLRVVGDVGGLVAGPATGVAWSAEGAAAATGVPAEPRRVVEVDIREFKFQADTVRVEVGGTVRWINRDALAHTSTADDGAWESPLIGPGETYTKRFVEVGTFPYHCTPHPFMRGVVIVEPRDGG